MLRRYYCADYRIIDPKSYYEKVCEYFGAEGIEDARRIAKEIEERGYFDSDENDEEIHYDLKFETLKEITEEEFKQLL
jgi:hypothetical protein